MYFPPFQKNATLSESLSARYKLDPVLWETDSCVW